MTKHNTIPLRTVSKTYVFFFVYNYGRYPTELYGLTPMQIIKGKTPDKHFYKERIAEAKRKRVLTNKAFNACALVR